MDLILSNLSGQISPNQHLVQQIRKNAPICELMQTLVSLTLNPPASLILIYQR